MTDGHRNLGSVWVRLKATKFAAERVLCRLQFSCLNLQQFGLLSFFLVERTLATKPSGTAPWHSVVNHHPDPQDLNLNLAEPKPCLNPGVLDLNPETLDLSEPILCHILWEPLTLQTPRAERSAKKESGHHAA